MGIGDTISFLSAESLPGNRHMETEIEGTVIDRDGNRLLVKWEDGKFSEIDAESSQIVNIARGLDA